MKKTGKKLLCLSLACAMALSLAGCGGKESSAPAAAPAGAQESGQAAGETGGNYKDTVIIGTDRQVNTLDPQESRTIQHKQIANCVYNRLFRINQTTKEIENELAESSQWLDDTYTTLEVKLKDNVHFQNGEKLTADDVVYTIMERGKDGISSSGVSVRFDSIEAKDDLTCVFHLSESNVDIRYNLTVADIMNRKACEEDPEKGFMIGTGPYMIDDYRLKDYIHMVRFDDYWEGTPVTPNVKFQYIGEASSRLIALQNHEVDVCMSPAKIELDYIRDDDSLRLEEWNTGAYTYLAFNVSKEPGNNKLLRQAIAGIIDKEQIITAAVEGQGVPAKTFWGQTLQFYYDGFPDRVYTVDEAKQMVIDAGYPDGVTLECSVNTDSANKAVAQVLQAQLKEIGVNMTINELDAGGFDTYRQNGLHNALIHSRTSNEFPEANRAQFKINGAGNNIKLNDQHIIDLYDEALTYDDNEKRAEIYKEIQETIAEECWYVPLYYTMNFAGVDKNLGGVEFGTYDSDFSGIYVTE